MNQIIDFFPEKIITILGGNEKFSQYPILKDLSKVYNPITIALHQNCPMFILSIKYNDEIYVEVFRQKSVINKEIWVCSCNSPIFSNKEFNIYKPNQFQKKEIVNIERLINKIGFVEVYNYTNGYNDITMYFKTNAELI